MTNNLEATTVVSKTGGSEEASVETALDEQSMIVSRDDGTAVQEENDETEVETLNEEYPLKEHEYNQTDGGVVGEEGENSGEERNEEDAIGNSEDNDLQNGENLREKNEGGAKILNVGYLLKEDGYNRTDAVVGGEDENSRIDKSEDNNQENVQNMEEKNEGGAAGVEKNNKGDIMEEDNDQENGQNTEEKNEGGTAGVDKDNKRDTLGKDEYEGKEEEKNIEKLEAISNQTTKKSKKGNTRKRKANENSEAKGEKKQVLKKVASEGKGKEYCGNLGSRDDNDQDSKGTEMGNLVYSCDDDGRSKKANSGDEAKMSPEKMVSEGRDSPELSEKKKKSFEQVDSMGMIFMCNSKTKKDCYHYKVLGLPANKREMVEKVYKGMKLFLYDVDLKLMYGIYKAAGHGGFSIEPKAFKSQFPSQVRFSIVDDCLPLAEEKFREVIKKNYYTKTKFDCKLTSDQVKNLCKLFISASKESCVQLKSETSMDRQSQPEICSTN
ncbi:hypothetical protein RND71_006710 [Anisodus tanguticus]|uniref:DCD domain-containing protein n=1 Tax=Anisodus tanguticus TaxID=243964 RepID=A0AAE1SRB3_9SOLA|nr:hypothetical protein RND71_006710 [Anisodus tanguticus]